MQSIKEETLAAFKSAQKEAAKNRRFHRIGRGRKSVITQHARLDKKTAYPDYCGEYLNNKAAMRAMKRLIRWQKANPTLPARQHHLHPKRQPRLVINAPSHIVRNAELAHARLKP